MDESDLDVYSVIANHNHNLRCAEYGVAANGDIWVHLEHIVAWGVNRDYIRTNGENIYSACPILISKPTNDWGSHIIYNTDNDEWFHTDGGGGIGMESLNKWLNKEKGNGNS